MQVCELKNAKTIIDELGHLVPIKNKHTVMEARATHVISSAINLIETLKANYDSELAEDLTKRLIRAILQEDPQKFHRKLNQIKKEGTSHGKK
jgi:flagellar biosynthesis/type III secretory pathway protein FliH